MTQGEKEFWSDYKANTEAAVKGGIHKGLTSLLIPVVIAAIGGITFASASTDKSLNDTDNKSVGVRSNMVLRIDHGTGCQYLETASGGIHPRISEDGLTHKGCKATGAL